MRSEPEKSQLDYDVVVVGGGTAGSMAARTAAAAGARTVMFNSGELGGLCILRGCMPSKTMLHAAHLLHEAAHHHTPGVGHADLGSDFAAVMANKDAKVQRFKRAKVREIEQGGYDVVNAEARFAGPDAVEAAGRLYRFSKGAVIASGSTHAVPPIEGLDEVPYLTSDDVMRLRARPRTLLTLGVGAVGLEMSFFFARLGTAVELISRRPVFQDVAPEIESEMVAVLRAEPNLTHHPCTRPLRLSREGGGILFEYESETGAQQLRAEQLLLAVGRRANVDGLGLHAAGVQVEDRRVVCDESLRTTNPRIFVAGDATNERLLLHVANWEGKVGGLGAAQVAGEHRVERRLHLEVVFTDPAMAALGMNRAQAEAAGHDTVVAMARFPETGRAIAMDVQHGLWLLVADRSSGEILGSQILGPRADDLIHVIAGVMFYRGTARDLLAMPWYHPTLSEVLPVLARDIERQRAVAPGSSR